MDRPAPGRGDLERFIRSAGLQDRVPVADERTLISGIETDPSKRALAAGLISFSDAIGATIVAEGIEHLEELAALQTLGVRYGQGYLLGRPADHALRAPDGSA